MYESMKTKVEGAVEIGKVNDEYICSEEERQILTQYRTKDFTRQNHPSVIQVLLNSKRDVDNRGRAMPNLIYVSREKSNSTPHHFKAGALNVLLRVSASMTNSAIILTLDCDMYSNDPLTAQKALCCLSNRSNRPNCGARPDHIVNKPINSREVLSLAHHVAGCNYENRTNWGSKMGFRYGSLVEDFYTGIRALVLFVWVYVSCGLRTRLFVFHLGTEYISKMVERSKNVAHKGTFAFRFWNNRVCNEAFRLVTSKVMDAELSRRYDQGMFEFGVPSPMFVPLATAAILNLIAFLGGGVLVLKERSFGSFFIQMFIAGFGVMNSLPFYEAMVLRRDKGGFLQRQHSLPLFL
ncbi:UNVERIFIED_CONTAM: Cellulose synthase-like protein G3 [Sesamum angustifolium]|uniref:Cellulose synthase-like protein G3 n=1 Tax=Sesamum angustifolium TaxID=2727405 RepID=A0AAW2MKV3_9LAMI